MAHFYGTLRGNRGEATRCGAKNSGIVTVAASWAGSIRTRLFIDDEGDDAYEITQETWQSSGIFEVIAHGKLGRPAIIDCVANALGVQS